MELVRNTRIEAKEEMVKKWSFWLGPLGHLEFFFCGFYKVNTSTYQILFFPLDSFLAFI